MSELICPSCGQFLERPTRFCPECGVSLAELPTTALVGPQQPPETPLPAPPPPFTAAGAPLADPPLRAAQTAALPGLAGGLPPPYPAPGLSASGSSGKRRRLWWLAGGFGCLALVFFGACASIGVLTLLGQRVGERATSNATPVPSVESGPPRNGSSSASGEVLLENDFSDGLVGDLDVSEDETSRSAYEDGTYVMEVKVPEMVVWSLVGGPYSDVSIEVEAEIPLGSDVAAAGVIFHYKDNDNFYLFSISNDGYYQLELLQEGEWIMLIDPTFTEGIAEGWNTLRVETRGSRIELYANGVLLEATADSTFSSGDAGLAMSTFEESTGTVRFDNLIIVRAE